MTPRRAFRHARAMYLTVALMRHDGMMDTTELLSVARTLAVETGELIINGRSRARVAGTKSSDIDIVTQMDLAAEQHLRDRLAELRPDDGILGEEGDDVASTSGVTWILDPIDGTVNYLYGLANFAVSVAAVTGPPRSQQWTPQVGAVYDGARNLWSAAAGRGATKNDAPLQRGGPTELSGTLVATGFQYVADRRIKQVDVLSRVIGHVRDIRRLGSAAVDLCLVAEGTIDAYYEHGLNSWDFAAAALIASEAGVKVAGIDGNPPNEALTIAAVDGVWQPLRDLLERAGARDLW